METLGGLSMFLNILSSLHLYLNIPAVKHFFQSTLQIHYAPVQISIKVPKTDKRTIEPKKTLKFPRSHQVFLRNKNPIIPPNFT